MEVRELTEKLSASLHFFPHRLKYSIDASISDLRRDLIEVIQDRHAERKVEAIYDPLTAHIHIIAGNVANLPSAQRALFHECFGHLGFRRVIGAKDADVFLDRLYEAKEDEVKDVARRYKVEISNIDSQRTLSEEWLAIQAENVPKSTWVQQATSIVRGWARKVMPDLPVTDDEVIGLLGRMRRACFATNRAIMFDRDHKEIIASHKGDLWYSVMAEVLENKLPGKGTSEQYIKLIDGWAKKGEFKAEEWEWERPAIEAWLRKRKGVVTKQQVLEAIKEVIVEPEVVIYSGIDPNEKYERLVDAYVSREQTQFDFQWDDEEQGVLIYDQNGEPMYDYGGTLLVYGDEGAARVELREQLKRDARNLSTEELALHTGIEIAEPGQHVRYSEYQLEGGEAYKEMLIRIPPPNVAQKAYQEYHDQLLDKYGAGMLGLTNTEYNRLDELDEIAKEEASSSYESSHYKDTDNIIVHARFNERVDKVGRKTLHIEEIQSDWHQSGRKYGYKVHSDTEATRIMDEVTTEKRSMAFGDDVIVKQNQSVGVRVQYPGIEGACAAAVLEDTARELLAERLARMDSRVQEIQGQGDRVPNAPFKTAWPALAMKALIRYAADNDFEQVTWTTGETQKERYNLEKHIDRIEYWAMPDGTYGFSAFKKGNDSVPDVKENHLHEADLEKHIGAELAGKVVTRLGATHKVGETQYGELKGVNHRYGGSGMVGFYDKILPATVSKLLKRWGVGVGDTSFAVPSNKVVEGMGELPSRPIRVVPCESGLGPYTLELEDTDVTWGAFQNEHEAERLLAKLQRQYDGMEELTVHAFEITPEMRNHVMPLFALKGRDDFSVSVVEVEDYHQRMEQIGDSLCEKTDLRQGGGL